MKHRRPVLTVLLIAAVTVALKSAPLFAARGTKGTHPG